MKQFLAAIIVAIAQGASPSGASTISTTALEVTGPQDGIFSLGPTAQYFGAGVVFELREDLRNVAMTLDINCLLPPCGGEIFLTRGDVIDGINIASLEDGAVFTGGGRQTFFGDGLNLAAGVYSLSLSMREGFGGWWGTTAPAYGGDGSVSYLRDGFTTSFNNGFPPDALWVANDTYDTGLTITADAPVSPVPLPAGVFLLASAIGILRLRARTP